MVDQFAVEKIEQNWQSILDLVNAAHRSMELVGDDAKWAKKCKKVELEISRSFPKNFVKN